MKKLLIISLWLFLIVTGVNAQIIKTVGATGANYPTLKSAFDAINAGTISGTITLQITGSTNETSSAAINASGAGSANYSSITIYPLETGITVSGNISGSLIQFNGADNVTVDGRVNGTGSTKDLTISNTNNATSATILFINSAENNIVKYCTIKGSETSSGKGVIHFSTASSGNGNDGNIIDNNNITSSASGRPINAVYSYGSAGYENSGNIISNNNIYDFLRTSNNSNGVNIPSASNDWIVSGNSFYETTVLIPTSGYTYHIIDIGATSSNITISGNYIGGREPGCGGSAYTITASLVQYWCGIFINCGPSITCNVQNNTIKNINYTSISGNPWDAIFLNSGNVNVTGNTVGATTGTGSITVTTPVASASATISGGVVTGITLIGGGSGYITPPVISFSVAGSTTPATATATLTGGVVTGITLNSGGSGYTSAPTVNFDGATYSTSHGIRCPSTGTINILNNNFGSITTVSSSYYSHCFETIVLSGTSGNYTISNNLVGSLTTPNSIQTSSTAANSLQKQDIRGIFSYLNTGTTRITGNTVANLTNGYTGTVSSKADGIYTSTGSNIIQNNTVRNISTGSTIAVTGIQQLSTTAGTSQTVTGNTVYNLSNTNASAAVIIRGIDFSGPNSGTNTVSGNFIHSLSLSSSNINSEVNGIVLNGLTTTSNNIISLGKGVTAGYKINGINDYSGPANTNNIYFNSVYIEGIVSSGTTSSTAALKNQFNTSTRNYRNNILFNARSGGSTGKHYAIILAGMANVTIDYNDYFVSSGVIGSIASLDKTTLALWKSGTGQDINSLNINPVYTNAGGTSASDYNSSAVLPAVSGTGITTDYNAVTRGTTPRMGALEVNDYTWQGSTSSDFATSSNWTNGAVPLDGSNITFAANPGNDCVLDQNRVVGNITNANATRKLLTNGKQLTINGTLSFTNGAQINATSASSVVVFAGTSSQSIPSGAFVNNTVDALTVNNTNGLTLNGDLTINQAFILSNGAFTIGANTLTLNGVISLASGTLTGGISSNISIGGSGAASLPAVTLNNLTVNRSSGINMAGSVSVSGNLVLTSGTIVVGANTLTISGSSPTGTSGSVDASNSNASIIFSNPTAITLPATFFTNSVNNLTLSGIGGVTATSNFTIAGILNLQKSNPSPTKGLLDLGIYTLTMGGSATTEGTGDVTGIITRTSFSFNTPYTFGNEATTINFSIGPLPQSLSVKIVLTETEPTWMNTTTGILRYYDIIRDNGTYTVTRLTLNLHYLDTELNGAPEGNLDLFDYHITSTTPHVDDHGRSNYHLDDNWFGLANLSLDYIAKGTTFDIKYWTLGTSTAANFTWVGAEGSTWVNTANWTGGVVPGTGNHVVIPDANTTPNDPELPETATIGYLLIQAGGVLNGGTSTTLTIDGGYLEGGGSASWDNNGIFIPGTSTVIFTNLKASMSNQTDFYNVTVADGATLSLGTDNIMRISGTLSLSATGVLNAANNHNTIEYNGTAQTVINPNGATAGYHNLILSGSETKSFPAASLSIAGDFSISGTASATAGDALTISGNLNIALGSTFNTGNFNHSLGGNFENNGTFTAAQGSTVTLNGTSDQLISGSSASNFDNLTINKNNIVTLYSNVNIANVLTLTSGNLNAGAATLGINGTISKSTSGFLDVNSQSSLTFGGTSAITLDNDLFISSTSINNLSINRSGGVTLGNQDITINGLLELSSGTLTLGANTLTISGSSPTKGISSGFIDAGNASATVAFTNPSAIILPSSIFTGNVNNLTINGTGGITASSDFTITGILDMQSLNPSAIKGTLDMWDGSAVKTLNMGSSATTVGVGDVTGIIRRSAITAGVTYTFGNQYMTAYFPNEGTLPSEISVKIRIGTAPSWRTGAIDREIEIIQTGGTATKAIFSCHYLDSELNGNDESRLVLWAGLPTNLEYGRSSYNSADNWVSLSNINVAFFSSVWSATKNITLDEYTDESTLIWNGALSDSWTSVENWTPNAGPSSITNIIIPDKSSTTYSPTLPAVTDIKTLSINANGVLNSTAGAQLTINGASSAWLNTGGTFNPGTSTVIFTNSAASISGANNFYNITINSGSDLSMEAGSIMKIGGTITNSGTWHTVINGSTTVEYNGSEQSVVIPNPSTNRYSTLILSGTGTKVMPASAMEILGDFSVSGTATTTLNSNLVVDGNLSISGGSKLSVASTKQLTVSGDFTNSAGTTGFVLESSAAGSASLINNTSGVSATVQRYLTKDKWHIISSPVSGQSIPAFLSDVENAIPTSGSNYGMMYYPELTGGWVYYTNPAVGDLSLGTGYLLRHTTDASVSLYGTLNATTTEMTITRSGNGWNSIGNPFPCPIGVRSDASSSENFLTYNSAQFDPSYAVLYLWNEPAVRTPGVSYYNIISNAGFTSSRPVIDQAYLQSGQGFLVKSKSDGGTMSFTTGMRIHENTGSFFKSAKSSWPGISLIVSTGTKSASTAVALHENMTPGLDVTFDAGLLGGDPSFRLYTRLVEDNGIIFMLQCLPEKGFDNMCVPIGFDYTDGGTVTFTADIVPLPAGIKAILADSLLGKFTDLQEPSATYIADIKPNTSGTGRFFLNISSTTTYTDYPVDINTLSIYSLRKEIIVNGKVVPGTKAELYDLLGRVIRNYNLNSPDSNILPANGIPSGVYILKVHGKGLDQNKKLFIK